MLKFQSFLFSHTILITDNYRKRKNTYKNTVISNTSKQRKNSENVLKKPKHVYKRRGKVFFENHRSRKIVLTEKKYIKIKCRIFVRFFVIIRETIRKIKQLLFYPQTRQHFLQKICFSCNLDKQFCQNNIILIIKNNETVAP